jgi:hypothetical protein
MCMNTEPLVLADNRRKQGRARGKRAKAQAMGEGPHRRLIKGEIMKQLAVVLAFIGALVVGASAHGNNEHVRGVVTQITETAITVQVSPGVVKTLTLGGHSMFEKGGKRMQRVDVNVGDRVVVDVAKGSSEAGLIRFSAPKTSAEKR